MNKIVKDLLITDQVSENKYDMKKAVSEFGQNSKKCFFGKRARKRLLNLDLCYEFSENRVKSNIICFKNGDNS